MSDTVKAAVIIGICLMLGLWGAGWLSKSDVGRWQRYGRDFDKGSEDEWNHGEILKLRSPKYWKIDTATGETKGITAGGGKAEHSD